MRPFIYAGYSGLLRLADWLLTEMQLIVLRLIDWRYCTLSNVVLLAGGLYLVGPIDLIPGGVPFWGHADEVGFPILGLIGSQILVPRPVRTRLRRSTVTGADLRLMARRATREIGLGTRAIARTGFAYLGARFTLRMAVGRWPTASETRQFIEGFRRHGTLPPILRGLVQVPVAQPYLTRAMLGSWIWTDESSRSQIRNELATSTPASSCDVLHVWTGPRISFLHIPKTGGSSIGYALELRCHPLQIDIERDTRHRLGDMVFEHPHILRQIRRCAVLWGHHDLPKLLRLDPGRFTFTVFREPAHRIVSLYEFWRSHDVTRLPESYGEAGYLLIAQSHDVLDFLCSNDVAIRNNIDNYYIRLLTGRWRSGGEPDLADEPGNSLEQAMAAFSRLDFSGVTERMDESMAVLGHLLDVELPRSIPRLNRTDANQDAGMPLYQPIKRARITPEVEAELNRLTRLDRVIYQASCNQLDTLSRAMLAS